jgi:hypothetical protein
MDAATQLALMAKAKNVFGNDQTFLSFPITPLPFTLQQLNFLTDFNIANLQTFSLLVNQIPNGEAWLPVEQHYLWDIYDDILKEGNFAVSSRTASEEEAYQAARSYLRVTHADGTGEDTIFYTTYKQHKDAFVLTQQRYLAAKSTADCSTEAAVQQQWIIDEPILRGELTECEQRWILAGYKNEVEAAQETIFQLGGRSPLQTRTEWRTKFNADLDTITSATNLMSVYLSSFSPSNALADGSWQPFKLTADEARVMLEQAPAEIRSRFAVNSVDPHLDSLSFEFSSAVIQRPWLASDALKARFWQFADPAKVLSNGATPPVGECPAYVTAVVFARNLTTTQKAANSATSTDSATTALQADFKFSVMEAAIAHPTQHLVKPRIQAMQQTTEIEAQPRNPMLAQNLQSTFTAQIDPAIRLSATRSSPIAAMKATAISDLRAERLNTDEPDTPLRLKRQAVFQRLEGTTFSRVNLPEHSQPGTPPPPDVDPNIYILAFICKQVPLCPNPDPNLQW